MLSPKSIFTQIQKLTADLISTGLCAKANFSGCYRKGNVTEIRVKSKESSIFLKSIPYEEMYRLLSERETYNIMMVDGAIISLYYLFNKGKLRSHRLSFFPSPDLSSFQNEPELYLEDILYADILDRRIVSVPLRFDFDIDVAVCRPVKHPISHLTIGQYKHCRIPVSSALTPYQFLNFIVMNFYHTAYEEFCDKFSVFKDCFEDTIFDEERQIIYMQTPQLD